MDFGKIEYSVSNGGAGGATVLRLTLIGQGDDDVLKREGLAGLRRRRIIRLANEARLQGLLLAYEDLSALLFTSLATLKRDVRQIEQVGEQVPLRGRRNGQRMKDGVEK